MSATTTRRIGILSNEFGDAEQGGRMGGFGWAAREAARVLLARPDLGIEPVFLTGERRPGPAGAPSLVHGVPLVAKGRSRLRHALDVRAARLDALLTIDWRPAYRLHALALPRTPLAVWVRDPRTAADRARVAAVRAPGAPDRPLEGLETPDSSSLAAVRRLSVLARRPFALVSPEPALAAKMPGAYGIEGEPLALLANPVALAPPGAVEKAPRPSVAVLGRLDPVKRPWLVFELARRMPEVEFLLLGRPHFAGERGWAPPSPGPANARLLGHVDGEEKGRLLGSAWALVNTSPHEGLAVSFLEALARETPLAAFVDTGGVVSRFGGCAGPSSGSGEAEVPALEAALRGLLGDRARRESLGRAGRCWVEETHGPARFAEGLEALLARLGVR